MPSSGNQVKTSIKFVIFKNYTIFRIFLRKVINYHRNVQIKENSIILRFPESKKQFKKLTKIPRRK
jgi:hypothetical protein